MRSSGDNVARRAGCEAGVTCEHDCRWELGLSGMANVSESLVNVVKVDE